MNLCPSYFKFFKKKRILFSSVFIVIAFTSCESHDDQQTSQTIVLKSDSNNSVEKEEIEEPIVKKSVQSSGEINTCLELALRILETSPHFKAKTKGLRESIIKNGGTNFGIMVEGSPNPEKDGANAYSTSYDFQLYESYPDHAPPIERYTFDANFKQLYLYDIIENELIPIDFDRTLLEKLSTFCPKETED